MRELARDLQEGDGVWRTFQVIHGRRQSGLAGRGSDLCLDGARRRIRDQSKILGFCVRGEKDRRSCESQA